MTDKEHYVSASEEESDVEEEKVEKTGEKVKFISLINRIMQNQPPLSQEEPGYLLGFVKYLEQQDHLPAELENCLHGLLKTGKVWMNATSNRLKKGVLEHLTSCKGLLGSSLEMSFDLKVMQNLKTLLESFKTMEITKEDCINYVSMVTTSTSRTTAAGATGCAGAIGGKKRKHLDLMLDETNLDFDDVTVEVEPSPTFPTYSSITVQKDGSYYTKKSADGWKDFLMKVTVYKREKLLDCQSARDKWNHRFMEMEVNFDRKDSFFRTMSLMRGQVEENLNAKNVNWVPLKRYKYE